MSGRTRNLSRDATPIGRTLRQVRQGAGLTQSDLATIVGVRQQTIGAWERGPDVPQVRFRDTLKTTVAWILEMHPDIVVGEDEPTEALGVEASTNMGSLDAQRERVLGAFLVRIEAGPELNDTEALILRDLINLPRTI